VAIAGAMLERNAPLPSRLARRRTSVRHRRSDALARHGHRPIARQPFGPVIESCSQQTFDEQCAHPGAVDEQISVDHIASVGMYGRDKAGFRMLVYLFYDSFVTLYALRFRP